jgi:hypothetical protein
MKRIMIARLSHWLNKAATPVEKDRTPLGRKIKRGLFFAGGPFDVHSS